MIRFSLHVLQRMFERGITQSDVQAALSAGRIVDDGARFAGAFHQASRSTS
ncbi:MAG: DUF4258 domain-containing protein [Candidatus Competibacteraceae bacterium]|nr:MAG: DUF4258 domain-containing protein [Candidatus Competibacteraceae bacterium]